MERGPAPKVLQIVIWNTYMRNHLHLHLHRLLIPFERLIHLSFPFLFLSFLFFHFISIPDFVMPIKGARYPFPHSSLSLAPSSPLEAIRQLIAFAQTITAACTHISLAQ